VKKIGIYFVLIFAISIALAKDNIPILFPSFSLLKMDSVSYITNKDLKDSVNTVFINFSPNCDHCQRTIKSILDNISKFKNTQFVLSSFEDFGEIRKFYFDYGIYSFTNIYLGQEIDFTLSKQVQYSSFPCLVIYDSNRKWIKKIPQESNAKTLIKVLKIE
jgi:thiol-disulfide isomerase/thioredoxin